MTTHGRTEGAVSAIENGQETTANLSPLQRALLALRKARARIEEFERAANEPIAIIGMSCRFPGGGNDPEAFWKALENGVDGIRRIPETRWPAEAMQIDNPATRWAGLLESVDQFDAAFFGIAPREAILMDPQQRMLLEASWEALESAGQTMAGWMGANVGVFVGIMTADYAQKARDANPFDPYCGIGNAHCVAAGRVSYALGLQGPSMIVDTACSSSLVTVHLACQSLRNQESDLALAGGVNAIVDPLTMAMTAGIQALSPDGRSKTFDAEANGFVRGEGCGIVVLKRFSDAQRDGDPIFAVIRGSVVNQDGRSTGLTTPNVLSQQAMLRRALEVARIQPEDIGYVETHGTGTSLGDPIEFEALREVIGKPRNDGSTCVLGALKTNVGHMEAAAGIGGLIKAVLCLQHEAIPKNLHFKTLNPRLSLEGTPFVIPTETIPWKSTGKPRRAGVSSFGISGTNAHVILEEAPRRDDKPFQQASSYVLPLSAKTPDALAALAKSYQEWFVHNDEPLHHVAYTASVRRTQHEHRLTVVGANKEEIAGLLAAFVAGEMPPGVATGKAAQSTPKVVFVFPGQGSQWIGMGRQLYREEPAFRDALVACDEALRKEAGFSVIEELDKPEETSRLHETIVAQPALFAIEVALAALLQAWGIVPSAVMGHSVGEIAAAYVAGMMDLAQAARLVSLRARVMQKATGHGKMVSVSLDEQAAINAIASFEDRVGIAAVNDPSSVVLSGDIESIDTIVEQLAASGVQARALRVNYAFHSPQMEPLAREFQDALGTIAVKPAKIPMISTVTGNVITHEQLDRAYWAKNIRQSVRFADALSSASSAGHSVFVEVGPHPVLTSSMEQTLAATNTVFRVVPTLRRNDDERKHALRALGTLHVQGYPIDWKQVCFGGRVIPLPPYPWQRERYWIESAAPKKTVAGQVYDAFNVMLQHGDGHEDEQWETYLTFGPLREIEPNFSLVSSALGTEMSPAHRQMMLESQREMRRVLFRHVDFQACERVLDFGCGYATDLMVLAKRHAHLQLDGYTISTEQAAVDVQRVERAGVGHRVHIHHRDSAKDDFPGQYDLVFGFEVAHHIRDKHALFANIGRHLRESGTLVLADFISNVTFEIEHEETSSFFLMKEQWVEVLSRHGLEVVDCIDISQEIANYLHDPDFDTTLAQATQKGLNQYSRSALTSYDRLGKMLRRGWTSYVLLSARKNSTLSAEQLEQRNRTALENLIPYEIANPGPARDPAEQCLFDVQWRRKELVSSASLAAVQGSWIVLGDREGLGNVLVERLAKLGGGCLRIIHASSYHQIATDVIELDISKTDDWVRLFAETGRDVQRIEGIVHLSSLDTTPTQDATPTTLTADLALTCVSTTALVQGLVRHGFRDVPRFFLVTRGAQSAHAHAPVAVAQAPLLGLGKTIAMEHPELRCTRIDLSPEADALEVDALLREFASPSNEDQIALRGASRYVARLVRSRFVGRNDAETNIEPAHSHQSVTVRPDTTYLITGGLGGLGLSVAQWLVDQGARHLVLVGRKEPTSAAQLAIAAMTNAGADVRVVSADVSRENDVEKLFATMQAEMPPLSGIIHAAAVLDDHTLLEQSEQSFQAVFAPKALGAWNLHVHSRSATLDFFVMYSSAASLLGSPGQANYCAANAFLDALSRERARLGLPAMSIQWGPFADVGMAAAQNDRRNRLAHRGAGAFTAVDGLQILQRLLAHPRPEIGVVRFDTRQWVEFYPAAAGIPFLTEIMTPDVSPEKATRRTREILQNLQSAPTEERSWLVERHVAEQVGLVLQLDPTRIDRVTPLQSLGLDSLMGLELRNRLEALLGVKLSATTTFTYPTVDAVARHLLELLGLHPHPTPSPNISILSTVVEMTTHADPLAGLSDEELIRAGQEILG